MNDEEPVGDEVLATIRVDDVSIDYETGVVDISLSAARKLAEWVRRYDLRPNKKPAKPWGRGR